MAQLNFVKGVNQGSSMELEGDRIILGRHQDCGVVLNSQAVSREHAVIRKISGKYYIEDMKSRNSTFVNGKEVTTRTQLKDNDKIKICDNVLAFFEHPSKSPPLPAELSGINEPDEDDETSSTVEATLSESSKQILEAQPAEKLAMLLDIGGELSQTFNLEVLLPKIVDRLFQVFRQADRGFIILLEDGKLIPKVSKTRRSAEDEGTARFSRKIVNRCLESASSVLSEDASSDKQFDLSQSITDAKIRSVMLAPLVGRTSPKAFGVIQLDTQDRFKKFNAEDLKLLLSVAGQAAIALESAKMHESLIARAGLERDLQLAHQVQLSFLPKAVPQAKGYEFFAFYESALEVGGDYYDFIPLPGDRLGVMVGDVAGKGMPAALLMAKVSSEARFCMLTEAGLAAAVTKLNDLMQEAGLLDRFITLGAGLVDTAAHQVTFVNAGHLAPLVFRKATGKFQEGTTRDMSGFPLGVSEGTIYDVCNVALEPGDCVAMFTDGVTDARNRQDQEFQQERVLAALQGGPVTPKAMGERLVAAVKKHALGCKQYDDITVVCFGRL